MSRIKWGAIVVDGRGKLGGHVFTKTRSGATMRTKVTPVNPQSAAQASARSRLGGNSQFWAQLAEDERLSWNSLASETSKTNVFGDQYFPSGKNLFTSVNNNLLLVGANRVQLAPSFGELPFIINMSVVINAVDLTINLSIEKEGELIGNTLVIEASKGMSPGRYNFDGTYRLITTSPNGVIPNESVLWEAYTSKFGLPSVGSKIGFRCYYINSTAGNASPRFASTSIVEQ